MVIVTSVPLTRRMLSCNSSAVSGSTCRGGPSNSTVDIRPTPEPEPVHVHAVRRAVKSWPRLLLVHHVDHCHPTGDGRVGAGKVEAGEVPCAEFPHAAGGPDLDGDRVVVPPDPDHLLLAAHFDAEPGGVPVQDRLQVGLLDPDPSPVRIGAPGRVGLLQPGEVLFRRPGLRLWCVQQTWRWTGAVDLGS